MAKRLQSILSQQSTYIRISIRCKLPGISSPATPPPTTRSYMLFLLPLVHCRRRLYYLTLRRGSLMCAAVIFKLNKYLPTNVLLQDSAALSQQVQSSSKLLVYYFHSMYICVAQGLNSDIISVCITYWQSYHATLHNTIPYFFSFSHSDKDYVCKPIFPLFKHVHLLSVYTIQCFVLCLSICTTRMPARPRRIVCATIYYIDRSSSNTIEFQASVLRFLRSQPTTCLASRRPPATFAYQPRSASTRCRRRPPRLLLPHEGHRGGPILNHSATRRHSISYTK